MQSLLKKVSTFSKSIAGVEKMLEMTTTDIINFKYRHYWIDNKLIGIDSTVIVSIVRTSTTYGKLHQYL